MNQRRTHGIVLCLAAALVTSVAACQPISPPPPTTTTTTTTQPCQPPTTTTTEEPTTTTEEPTTTTTTEEPTTTTTTTTTEEPTTTTTTEEPTTTTTEEPTTTTTEEPTTTTTTTEEPTTTTTTEEPTTTTTEEPTTTTTTEEVMGATAAPCEPTTTTTIEPTTTTSEEPTTTTAPPPSQPDLLFVMLDDESPDTTPYYMPRTFAKLAGPHWYKFTNAVTPTPLCGPARATALTGQTVDHHGLNCNQGTSTICQRWGGLRSKTVPKALANAGVWVGWYGKRLNWDHECTKFEGQKHGWPNLPGVLDDHVHYIDTNEMFTKYQLVENGVRNQYDMATQGPSVYGTYKTAELTAAGIQNCVSPCTLYWMPQAPHAPGTPPPDYDASKVLPGATAYQPAFNEGCPGATDPDIRDKPYLLQTYAPCVGSVWKRTKTAPSLQGVDNRLPELIDAFLAKNPDRPKRIIFTSDHGREMGNHRHTPKEVPYEMSVRVPLYIYDSEAPGGTIDALVNLRDLPATILDWQRATPLLPLDGRSLVPLYTGTTTDWDDDTYMSHFYTTASMDDARPWRAVRQDCVVAAAEHRHCLKVVLYPAATVTIQNVGDVSLPDEWEVYVLDQDPWELHNVHANLRTGYVGVAGWDDTNPELSAAKTSLAVHMATGK